jgi:hypothetical protein
MVHCARDSTRYRNPCIVEYIVLCSLRMCVCRQCSLGVHPMKCQICGNRALQRRDVGVYAGQHPDRAIGQISLGVRTSCSSSPHAIGHWQHLANEASFDTEIRIYLYSSIYAQSFQSPSAIIL